MKERPAVYVGSSSEGLPIAEALQELLDGSCAVELWSQGVFGLSQGILESLTLAPDRFDFAVLVLSGDDLTSERGKASVVPRDNVLFELGLFIGRLGRERTYILYERSRPPKLPTDLDGVTAATFELHDSGNLTASLGAAATKIKKQIQRLGPRREGEGVQFGHDTLVMLDRLSQLKGLDKKLAKATKVKMCGWSLKHVVDNYRHSLRELQPGCELQIIILDPDSSTVESLDNIITYSDPIAYKARGWPMTVNKGICSSDLQATLALLRENSLLPHVRLCNSLLPFGLILVECADKEAWLTVQIYTLHPNLRFDRRLAFSLEGKGSRLWSLLEEQFDLAWEDPNFSRSIEPDRGSEERPAPA